MGLNPGNEASLAESIPPDLVLSILLAPPFMVEMIVCALREDIDAVVAPGDGCGG